MEEAITGLPETSLHGDDIIEFVGRLNREPVDLSTCTLDYNGRIYRFYEGDIHGLRGTGLIVIVTKSGLEYQGHRGYFHNIRMNQIDGASFINGINVDELVKTMEEIKN